MKKLTLGFIFDSSLSHVLLIHKEKPEWQKGRVNGLGGKVEEGETAVECIAREVFEESGLSTREMDWVHVAEMIGRVQGWWVDVFGLVYSGERADAKTTTEERVEWFPVDALPREILQNLSWFVPMVRDKLLSREFEKVSIEYIHRG